jgi:hypothetical protein
MRNRLEMTTDNPKTSVPKKFNKKTPDFKTDVLRTRVKLRGTTPICRNKKTTSSSTVKIHLYSSLITGATVAASFVNE